MKSFFKLALLAAVFMLPLLLAAGVPDIAALAEKAVSRNYPDADSVLLYDLEQMTYQTDGTAVSTDEFYQKVLNEAGRRELRRIPLHCNTHYGTARFVAAAILRNGKKIDIDINKNSSVSTSAQQMSSNIYDPAMKVTVLTIPGLEIGDVLYLKTERKTLKPVIPGEWSTINTLESDVPIMRYDIEINAPEKLPLLHTVIKNEIKGKIKTFAPEKRDGRIIYKWQALDVPQAITEPGMPELYTCCQRLLAGTAKDWQSISKWYYNICRPHMDAVSDEMRRTVKKLVEGISSDDEKIRRIFKYVSQNIRYTGITSEKDAPGFEPHDVRDTFSQKHGVCRDKAVLLASMLELAGLKAYPVIFMAGTPKDSDVPNGYFNHAVACVDKGNFNYVMMDPTDENTRTLFPEYLSNQSFLVARPEGDILRRTPVIPAEKNCMKITTSAGFNNAGTLSGKTTMEFSGINDLIYRSSFSRMTPEKRLEFWNSRIRKALPGAQVVSLDITPENIRDTSKPLVAKFTFTAAVSRPDSGDPEVLDTPQFARHFGTLNWLLPDTSRVSRRFPIATDSTCKVEEKLQLTLTPRMKTVGIPPARGGKNNSFSWHQKFNVKDNVITLDTSASLDSVEIVPDDYQQFRRELHRFFSAGKQIPVVKKDFSGFDAVQYNRMFPDADAVVLDWHDELTLDEKLNFISVQHRKIVILTYAGIKRYSELKEYFYPSRESVEITAAVTSKDGKTVALSPAHIRFMDAPWTADLKHVPAAKIQVCALPGVDLYSTIEYTVTRKGRKLWGAAGCSVIRQHIPVLNWSLQIDTPEKLRLRTSVIPQNVDYQRKNINGTVSRSWRAGNISGVKREYSQSELRFFVPHISYSAVTAGEFSALFNDILKEKASQRSSTAEKECFGTLNIQTMPLEERAEYIRNFVVRRVRVSGPAATEVPEEALRTPEEIFTSGRATTAERAVLLSSLFTAAGIKHRFHLAGNKLFSGAAYRDFSHCFAPEFDTVLLFVPELNAYFNDTSQYSSIGYTPHNAKLGINLENGRLSAVNSSPEADNRVTKQYDVQIRSDKSAVIRITETLSGCFFEDANRKYSEMTPEFKKLHFISKVYALDKSARLNGQYSVSKKGKKLIVKYSAVVPAFAHAAGEYLTFELPGHASLRELASVPGAQRSTPFVRDTPVKAQFEWKITAPRGYIHRMSGSWNRQTGTPGTAELIERRSAVRREMNVSLKLILPAVFVEPTDFDRLVLVQNVLSRSGSRCGILKKEK